MRHTADFSSRQDRLRSNTLIIQGGGNDCHDDDGATHDAIATDGNDSRAQQQQREEEKESPSLITTNASGINGYVADASSDSRNGGSNSDLDTTSDQQSSPSDKKLGWVIDISKRRIRSSSSSSRRSSRRCRRGGGDHKRRIKSMMTEISLPFPLSKPAPSPIHPDIDISLTKHITTSEFMVGPEIVPATATTDISFQAESVSSINAVEALSSFVLNYLGGSRTTVNGEGNGSPSRTAIVAPPYPPARNSEETTPRDESRSAADANLSKMKTEIPSRKRTQSNQSPCFSPENKLRLSPPSRSSDVVPSNKTMFPQVISDVASFSTYQYTLEDALDLTDTPRYIYCDDVFPAGLVYLMNSYHSMYSFFLIFFSLSFSVVVLPPALPLT
jgi:hypothetical protein